MKLKEKIEAIRLRKLGESFSEIREKIKVSKGTLSLWLRDVKLSPEQEQIIYATWRQKHAYRLAKANQEKRESSIKKIAFEAKKEAVSLFGNPLFLAGLMLYWAEGDKSELREALKFSNSDPAMIKFMMRWFREICLVPEDKFRIALHIHTFHCRQDIEGYWSKLTNIPRSQFHKTQIKPTSLGQRRNPLYDGTCAISIHNRDLFRRIRGWKLAFIEKYNR